MLGPGQTSVAPSVRTRPGGLALAGLCVSVAGLLLVFSIRVLIHTPYELSLYWPWLRPGGVIVGAAGCLISTVAFIWSARRETGLAVPVIGMAAGLLPAALVAVPIAEFFVLTMLFGA